MTSKPLCIVMQVGSIAAEKMRELHSDRDKIVENTDTTRNAVKFFFNSLRTALDEREKAVFNTVQKYTDIKLSTLDLYHQKLQEDKAAIARAVESLETLLHRNDSHLDCSLLTNGAPLEEELEIHTQSVLSVCENLQQDKLAAKSLSFSGDRALLGETLKEAGVLNECQLIPDTNILSMQRVVVSEQEDPYLLVPSRFEDLLGDSPRKEVRIDGTKKSQRVMQMSDLVEDENVQYQIPREWVMRPSSNSPPLTIKQQPLKDDTDTSIIEVDLEVKPQVPLHRTRGKMLAPPPPRHARQHEEHRASLECQPPLLPPKPAASPAAADGGGGDGGGDDLYSVPRPAALEATQEVYDVPRSLLLQDLDTAEDTYQVPRLQELDDGQQEIYSVPHPLEDVQQDIYSVPRPLEDVQQDIYSVPRPQDGATDDIYDVPKLQDLSSPFPQDVYDVPQMPTLQSPMSPALQEEPDDIIYDVPAEPPPPPRPPKPCQNGVTSPPALSPPPRGEPSSRGPSPKPKPRTLSYKNPHYTNTTFPILPRRDSGSPVPSPLEQQLSASVTVLPSKPVPTPRVRRSQTFHNDSPNVMKQLPQSAPPIEDRSTKFQWNGEALSADTTRHMNTLPPAIKSRGLGLCLDIKKPVAIITGKQLCTSATGGDQQVYPCGVCCSPVTDTLVVTDVYNHCVRLVDPSTGRVLERIGKEGRSSGNFKEPCAVVMDDCEHIFVTELDNPRVQKFTSRGKYLLKFGQKAFWGNQLHDPYGLTLSPDGRLYITDWEKGRVLIYQKDGRHVSTIGKEKDKKFLKFPAGLVFDRWGNLLVTDRGRHCVWIMSPDGKPVSRIGKLGTGNGELLLPHGIAVLNDNTIAVSESGNHRISLFAPNGSFLSSFGQKGSEPGMFHYPRHLCVDSKGRLIVADEHNQRIQIFDLN